MVESLSRGRSFPTAALDPGSRHHIHSQRGKPGSGLLPAGVIKANTDEPSSAAGDRPPLPPPHSPPPLPLIELAIVALVHRRGVNARGLIFH